MSFDSQHPQGGPVYSQSFPNSQQGSFNNGPVSGVYSRSFGGRAQVPRQYEDNTQIYTVRISVNVAHYGPPRLTLFS
jgi:hypothetical protein